MYFHAASMAPSVPSMATSRALTTVVTSIATHNSPRLLTTGAIAMAQAKRLRPAKQAPPVEAGPAATGASAET